MRELAEDIAAWEHDTSVKQLTSDERQRVYIALYQTHLPKLDDYDAIEYDQDRGIVEPTGLLEVFDQYLGDGLHHPEDRLLLSPEAGGTESDEAEKSKLTSAVSGLFSK